MPKENYVITRKVKLHPVGDGEEIKRVYKYIHDGMHNQNKAYNILASTIYTKIFTGCDKDELNDIYKRGARNPKENDSSYSLYKYNEIVFPKGMSTASTVKQKVKAYFKQAQKDGLFKGKVSLQNRKLTAPLWIERQQFSFYYPYETYQEFLDYLYKKDCEIYMKFVNGIVFKVILGNNISKSREIRSVFQKIFEEEYIPRGSSIQFKKEEIKDENGDKKKKNSIILNLSLQIPKKETELNEDTVVGVDLGIAVPAYCALNNNKYQKSAIGYADDFIWVRTKIQAQRRRLSSNLKYSNGGHGRKKKMRSMDRFTKTEKNFATTYNHMVSKRVVDFAIKNKAKYINLENLKGFDRDKTILRNWSYFQLQQFITYKADKYGIIVRKINPYHTSQICSCCGHWEEDQRNGRKFKCKSCGFEENADFNAARNIAMSTEFVDGNEDEEEIQYD